MQQENGQGCLFFIFNILIKIFGPLKSSATTRELSKVSDIGEKRYSLSTVLPHMVVHPAKLLECYQLLFKKADAISCETEATVEQSSRAVKAELVKAL